MNKYYVYKHIRLDTNSVFYVGKGYGNRAWKRSIRNKYWGHVVSSVGYRVEIIEDFLEEDIANSREIFWIDFYKKQNQRETNFQLGGHSSSRGIKHECVDCGNSVKNIYAKRCQKCRTIFKKTSEYYTIHSEGQRKRFRNPEQRALVASLRLGKPPSNKGVTGGKLSEQHKSKISRSLRKRYAT